MKTRCLSLLLFALLALPSVGRAQQLVVQPDRPAVAPVYFPNVIYSPYPGIWAPLPYPNWNYPPHWIYSYMRFDDGRNRRNDDYEGRTYRGRDTLAPAVPYSDYLKDQQALLKSREAMAKPAPTANKALLEIRVPTDKAKLFFDGKEAVGEGETRTFLTPPLKAGESYSFTLKTVWPGLLDDRTNEAVVNFRAGEHKTIDLRPKN